MKNDALVVEKNDRQFSCSVKAIEIPVIENEEILIQVSYSSLNYKDALSSIGNPGVSRIFPHVTGIDAVGKVLESRYKPIKVGDRVVITGYDLGMNTKGGHQNYLKAPGKWAVPIHDLEDPDYMVYGTAGLTAAISVYEMIKSGTQTQDGEILVTGATGGVGSVAIAILAKLGYNVVAVSGKLDQHNFLKTLGAQKIINREELEKTSSKPLLSEKYAGMIDTVGGTILAEALKTIQYHGIVTCCGLTASPQLHTTVFPFILRGIRLVGIESVYYNMEKRKNLWKKLETEWNVSSMDSLVTQISLAEIPKYYKLFLKGAVCGRVIVQL